MVTIDQIKRVLVIGSGTMGLQIGLQCATHGYRVALYDAEPGALDAAPKRLRAYGEEQVAAGHIDADHLEHALAAITLSTDPAVAAQDVDLVSECVPEDPELKARVLAQFGALCSPRTIFTTNTSTLVPSMYAAATGRPDRFAALHFHQPVWSGNVVDIMPHPGTAPGTVDLLVEFAHRIGQIPIRLNKEHYNYVFNAMYAALNTAAIGLAAGGVASIEDVDRAWMGITKMPIGPFGMLDLVGLDTTLDIIEYWAARIRDPNLRANADFLRGYVERGHLGRKTGEGFYRYPHPAFAAPGFVEADSLQG